MAARALPADTVQSGSQLTVTTADDHDDGQCTAADCSLREAINLANATSGEHTIVFSVPSGSNISLQAALGTFTISQSLSIQGPGSGQLVLEGVAHTFYFSAGTNSLSGVTIENSKAQVSIGSVSPGVVAGGALFNDTNSVLTLEDCIFDTNEADGANTIAPGRAGGDGLGGAIYNAGVLTADRCKFYNNVVEGGKGAMGAIAKDTSKFGGKGGDAEGGAIYNIGTLTVTNSIFVKNFAGGGQGGDGANAADRGGDGGQAVGGITNAGTMTVTSATLIENDGLGGFPGTGGAVGNEAQRGLGVGNLADRSAGGSIIRNTLSFLSNELNGAGNSDADGSFISQGYNIIGSGESSSGFTATGDQVGTAAAPIYPPLSASLAPSIGSPAIDAGKAFGLTEDAVGNPRTMDFSTIANAPGGDGTDIGAVELQSVPAALANISTRLRVETGDNVLIGGFILGGTQPKKIIVRAIGPSLPFADALANPTLELHDSAGNILDSNDDWVSSSNMQAIMDSTIPPTNSLESAIVATLPAMDAGNHPAGYTAIVRGANGTAGIGLVEVYDLNGNVDSSLANISTRGPVQGGDNVLIAGTILEAEQLLIIRAIGPSLSVPGALADPSLELHDGNGALIDSNDNWPNSPDAQAIMTSGLAPTSGAESVVFDHLNAGNYTAIVRGVNGTSGVGLVEIYALGP